MTCKRRFVPTVNRRAKTKHEKRDIGRQERRKNEKHVKHGKAAVQSMKDERMNAVNADYLICLLRIAFTCNEYTSVPSSITRLPSQINVLARTYYTVTHAHKSRKPHAEPPQKHD